MFARSRARSRTAFVPGGVVSPAWCRPGHTSTTLPAGWNARLSDRLTHAAARRWRDSALGRGTVRLIRWLDRQQLWICDGSSPVWRRLEYHKRHKSCMIFPFFQVSTFSGVLLPCFVPTGSAAWRSYRPQAILARRVRHQLCVLVSTSSSIGYKFNETCE
jgi:hypothetical protein